MSDLDFEIIEQIREALGERAVDYFQEQRFSMNDALVRISSAESQLYAQQQTISELRSQVGFLEAEKTRLETELNDLEVDYIALKARFETLESEL